MNRANSKLISEKSWQVLKSNKYLIAFPLVGFIAALIPLIIFWGIAIGFFAVDRNWLGFAFIIIGLFAMQCVLSVFAGGIVACADEELAGRPSTFRYGLSKAMGRFGTLVQWAVVQTIMNIVTSFIRGDGESGVVSLILRSVAASIVGIAWRIVSFFALPFIMLEHTSVPTALKSSASLFRKQWGNTIVGSVRVMWRFAVFLVLPGLALIIIGLLLLVNDHASIGAPLIVIGTPLLILGTLFTSAIKSIFAVALFRYAHDGEALAPFTRDELQSSIDAKAAA